MIALDNPSANRVLFAGAAIVALLAGPFAASAQGVKPAPAAKKEDGGELGKGMRLMMEKKYAEAARVFQGIRKDSPAYVTAQLNLAEARLYTNQPWEAWKSMQNVLAVQPMNQFHGNVKRGRIATIYRRIAADCKRLKKCGREAYTALMMSYALYPEDEFARVRAREWSDKLLSEKKAREVFAANDQVRNLYSDSTAPLKWMARARWHEGDIEGAGKLFAEAGWTDIDAFVEYCARLMDKGYQEKAVAFLEEKIRIFPIAREAERKRLEEVLDGLKAGKTPVVEEERQFLEFKKALEERAKKEAAGAFNSAPGPASP
ncbi:MAG: hypothetical protein GMKNLPBB_01932 [Myxococcota bacterium]|nr:hypothetical protein [Myxococcota bacterium]